MDRAAGKEFDIMDRVGIIFLTWKRHIQQGLKPYGITLKQFFLLRQLEKRAFLFPADVARMLFCDRPTATVIIKNLEKHGWLISQRDPENGKRRRITITVAGSEKLHAVPESLYEIAAMSFNPYGCFNGKERERLELLLVKLQKHLEKIRK